MYCPQCASSGLELQQHKCLECKACGFTYFHNVATAVAALIVVNNEVLLIRRARDPGRGLLGLAGGFVDPFESAEQALFREIHEELGLQLSVKAEYLGAWANEYNYKNVKYHTQDIYYVIYLPSKPMMQLAPEEVSEVVWKAKQEVNLEELAFCSARDALAYWLKQ
ncbi:NUDIX domain-containing protein [Alteromonadaceae bacterium BrNp21-10]|nr:NUDIX domain-containing protein [Alteromonadaceae bacterium BrNp21-10]